MIYKTPGTYPLFPLHTLSFRSTEHLVLIFIIGLSFQLVISMPYRLRSVGLLAKACIRLSQYSCPRQKAIQQRQQSSTSPSVALKDRLQSNAENRMVSAFQKCRRTGTGVENITPDFHCLHDLPMIHASQDAGLTMNTGHNWLQLENNLDENEIQKRKYEPNTVSLQRWVWNLWCRYVFFGLNPSELPRVEFVNMLSRLQVLWGNKSRSPSAHERRPS